MPTNVTPHYQKAEQEYFQAKTNEQKIKALKRMLSLAPTHKGGEALRANIKQRIAKLKYAHEKELQYAKGKGGGLTIKKEGVAQVVLIGKTNSGKSFLLSKITNANPLVAEYEYTTKKPEIGTMEYNGIPIQIVEMPAITENYLEKDKGPMFLGIIRGSDLIVILAEDKNEEKFIKNELKFAGIKGNQIVVKKKEDPYHIKNKIWNFLDLIYVFTKTPGKEKDYPPVALKKMSTVRDLALNVHKDFVKKFSFAKVWGSSVKHSGARCGLNHLLHKGDVVELHVK